MKKETEQDNWKEELTKFCLEINKNLSEDDIFANAYISIDQEQKLQSFIENLLSSQAHALKEKMKAKVISMKIMRKYVTDQGIVIMKEQGCKRNTTLNELLSAIESIEI